jgi:hypothetical protein
MLESKHRRLEQIGSASSDARVNECLLHRYIWQKSPRDLNDVQTTGSGQGIEYSYIQYLALWSRDAMRP